MKKLIFLGAITAIMASCSGAKSGEEKTEQKDHVCTEACKESGQCVTVCGEKGHTCSAECKKKM